MTLKEKIQMYEKKIGDEFPSYPIMLNNTDEEVIDIIDKCLEKGKNVYELGYLKKDAVY